MKKNKGFTFVELTIATVVFSVAAVAIYACFNTGVLAWRKGEVSSSVYQDARAALELMATDLRSSLASEKWNFQGSAQAVNFVSLSRPFWQKAVDVESMRKISYRVEEDKLLRSREDIRTLLTGAETEQEVETQQEAGELLQFVESLKFEYYYKDPASEGKFLWRDAWDVPEDAPKAVKITIALKPEIEGRRQAGPGRVQFSKHVIIPTGIIGGEEEEGEEEYEE